MLRVKYDNIIETINHHLCETGTRGHFKRRGAAAIRVNLVKENGGPFMLAAKNYRD